MYPLLYQCYQVFWKLRKFQKRNSVDRAIDLICNTMQCYNVNKLHLIKYVKHILNFKYIAVRCSALKLIYFRFI